MKKKEKIEAEKPTKDEISVFEGSNLIRTYSKEVHGADYEELARLFISDRPTYSLK